MNNLKQLGLGISLYSSDGDGYGLSRGRWLYHVGALSGINQWHLHNDYGNGYAVLGTLHEFRYVTDGRLFICPSSNRKYADPSKPGADSDYTPNNKIVAMEYWGTFKPNSRRMRLDAIPEELPIAADRYTVEQGRFYTNPMSHTNNYINFLYADGHVLGYKDHDESIAWAISQIPWGDTNYSAFTAAVTEPYK